MWDEWEKDAQQRVDRAKLTADDIRSMPMDEYAKIRGKLMDYGKERLNRNQAEWNAEVWELEVEQTCMWCGEVIAGDVEAHEEECGG